MDTRKSLVCNALRAWIAQRPGLEFDNYSDGTAYRAELRSIARDLREGRVLLASVENNDSISADDIIDAARHAFSGRLSLEFRPVQNAGYYGVTAEYCAIDYCTGQYWPTEYRLAVAAVCASALWASDRAWFERNGWPANKSPGDALRGGMINRFGRGIARRWFQ